MTWNNKKTEEHKATTAPGRTQVLAFLRGLEQRNLRRPGAKGYTEFGIMIKAAADIIEHGEIN